MNGGPNNIMETNFVSTMNNKILTIVTKSQLNLE